MIEYRELDFLGFPGYRAGDNGSVWSRLESKRLPNGRFDNVSQQGKKWRKLKPELVNRYLRVVLSHNKKTCKKTIHRLILEVFVGPCPLGMQACHNNGNPTDNKLNNLRWDTPKNNHKDRIKHGTSSRGVQNGRAKLTEKQVIEIRRLYKIENYTQNCYI